MTCKDELKAWCGACWRQLCKSQNFVWDSVARCISLRPNWVDFMANDDLLFLSRRLGFGLRPDEAIVGKFRDWAVKQLTNAPPLDFYGPDGKSIRSDFLPEAEPLKNFAEACREWEKYTFAKKAAEKEGKGLGDQGYNRLMHDKVWMPYQEIPIWRDCLVSTLTAVNGQARYPSGFGLFGLIILLSHRAILTVNCLLAPMGESFAIECPASSRISCMMRSLTRQCYTISTTTFPPGHIQSKPCAAGAT